ncbi:hypothetical protein F2P79_026045, partial [Pimephales promelas]
IGQISEKPLAASCGGDPTRPHPSVTSEATTPMPKLDTFSLTFKNRKNYREEKTRRR